MLEYKNVNFENAASSFLISSAATEAYSGQTLKVHLDSPDNPAIGEVVIPTTEEWSTYVETSAELTSSIPAGNHDIYITFAGTPARLVCDFYYIEFKE